MSNRSAYTIQGDRHYSYQTIIRQTLPGGLTLGNVTVYSPTTSKHQLAAGVNQCDVLLDNVDKGTSDLAKIAYSRGLISLHLTAERDASGMHYVEKYILPDTLPSP